MSAINPASFASPSLGLQAPSGIGPGAVGVSRTTQSRPQPAEQTSYSVPQAGRGYQNVFAQPFTAAADRSMPPTAFQPSGYTYCYTPFNAAPRNAAMAPSAFGLEQFTGFPAPAPQDYQGMPARFPSPHGANAIHDVNEFGRNAPALPSSDGWMNNFQGLSLNTR